MACVNDGLEKLLTEVVLALELAGGMGGRKVGGGMAESFPLDKAVTWEELDESLSEGSMCCTLA